MEIEKLSEDEIIAKDFKPISTDNGTYYTYDIGNSNFVAIDDRSERRDVWGYRGGKRMQKDEAERHINKIFNKDEKADTFISKRTKIAWNEIAPEFLQMQQDKAQDELIILSTQDDHVEVGNTKGAHYKVLREGNEVVACSCEDWYYRGNTLNPCKHMVRAQMAIGPEKLVKGEPKEEHNQALVPRGETAMPIPSIESPIITPLSVEQYKGFYNKYQELKDHILSDDDYMYFGKDGRPTTKGKGEPYLKKQGWRKISLGMNLSCGIVSRRRITGEDSRGKYYGWLYHVRVVAPNGRCQDAEGCCTSRNPFFSKKYGKPVDPKEEDIVHTAQTRAFNRGVGDMVGSAGPSAEEMVGIIEEE